MRTPSIHLIAAVVLLASLARADVPKIYTLEAKFIAMTTNGVIEITSDAAKASKDSICLGPNLKVQLDGRTVIKTQGGTVDFDSTFRGLDVLSAPRVATLAGREAAIMVGTEPPEYFVPTKEGTYRLEKMNEGPGVSMKCTIEPVGAEPRRVMLDLECRMVELGGREALPGVTLPVGPPVMRAREVNTKVSVQLEDWICIGGLGPTGGAGPSDGLVILVRVTEGEPKP